MKFCLSFFFCWLRSTYSNIGNAKPALRRGHHSITLPLDKTPCLRGEDSFRNINRTTGDVLLTKLIVPTNYHQCKVQCSKIHPKIYSMVVGKTCVAGFRYLIPVMPGNWAWMLSSSTEPSGSTCTLKQIMKCYIWKVKSCGYLARLSSLFPTD